MPQGILKLLGLKPENIIKEAGKVLDGMITNKEELAAAKLTLEQELNRHMEAMAEWQMKELADARQKEVQLRNTVGIWMQNIAAGSVILSFVGLLFCVIYQQVPTDNKELINIMLGSLGTIVVQIFQYWFGSSAGSARKQQYIEKE